MLRALTVRSCRTASAPARSGTTVSSAATTRPPGPATGAATVVSPAMSSPSQVAIRVSRVTDSACSSWSARIRVREVKRGSPVATTERVTAAGAKASRTLPSALACSGSCAPAAKEVAGARPVFST